MPVTTITDRGSVITEQTIDIINANFALGTFTPPGGALEVTGSLTVDTTTTLTGDATASGKLTVTGLLTRGPVQLALTAITANGAIAPHTSANYVFTKAGVAAMTLAAPTATTDDGIVIVLTNSTVNQNTITATGLFLSGASGTDVATYPAAKGATITLMAYQAKWLVLENNGVVFS